MKPAKQNSTSTFAVCFAPDRISYLGHATNMNPKWCKGENVCMKKKKAEDTMEFTLILSRSGFHYVQ